MFGVDGGKVPPQISIDGEPFLDRDVGSCFDFKKPLFSRSQWHLHGKCFFSPVYEYIIYGTFFK